MRVDFNMAQLHFGLVLLQYKKEKENNLAKFVCYKTQRVFKMNPSDVFKVMDHHDMELAIVPKAFYGDYYGDFQSRL